MGALWDRPEALWDLFSLGMTGWLSSSSLSDLDSSSDQGFLFFTFLEGVPFGAGVFLTLGAPATTPAVAGVLV